MKIMKMFFFVFVKVFALRATKPARRLDNGAFTGWTMVRLVIWAGIYYFPLIVDKKEIMNSEKKK